MNLVAVLKILLCETMMRMDLTKKAFHMCLGFDTDIRVLSWLKVHGIIGLGIFPTSALWPRLEAGARGENWADEALVDIDSWGWQRLCLRQAVE